ncbi:HlyD family efflux transporter periplasmic adaptor subunit [Paludisphaera sp.]|uniref:efflux RND transporter periplasmic adaptor subunit n=1 Tax=Paludisphaera sp. TaxID=2017432 RepID=UPI00301C174D
MNARIRILAAVATASVGLVAASRAQGPPTSAVIDTEPIALTPPERYQVVAALEPIRTVTIVAPADGYLKSVDAPAGSTVRQAQQVAEMDRAEAAARLKIAEAELRERKALAGESPTAVGAAVVEAAEGRVELARLELDRLTLRAPFAGRIVSAPVASGQFVLKGTVIAELADLSTLKALVPVDRREVKAGGEATAAIEDQRRTARVQSIVPLPATEEYRPLRELAAPIAGAWVQVQNADGALEPGLRVRSVSLPVAPVAVVPRSAVKAAGAGGTDATVQVIRAEHVADVRVKTLGEVGPERVQVSGPFRSSDAVVVSTSVPLVSGTFIRFGVEGMLEGAPPNPNQPGRAAAVPSPPSTSTARTPPARRPPPAPANQPGATPF